VRLDPQAQHLGSLSRCQQWLNLVGKSRSFGLSPHLLEPYHFTLSTRCVVHEYEGGKKATSHRSHRSLEESPRHFPSFPLTLLPLCPCNIISSRRHQPHGRSKRLQGSVEAYDLRLLPESTCIEGLYQGYNHCPADLVQGPGDSHFGPGG